MNNFDSLELSKFAQNSAMNDKISQVLSEIMHNLHEKLLKKEIRCECENNQDLCFDCLRFEAETMLAEDFQIPEMSEIDLENYSNLLDHELDTQVAKIVTDHEEKI